MSDIIDAEFEEPELTPEQQELATGFEDADTKMAAFYAIRKHYAEHGAKNWRVVKDQFPTIQDRQFWRLVKKVKEGVPDVEILKSTIAFCKAAAAKKVLPAAPSPAIIYSGGPEARKSIDFMTHMHEMLDDINQLRDHALMPPDKDGKRKIHNPHVFAQAIKLRGEVLDRALKAYESVWDMRKMQDFYGAILDEVQQCDPKTAARIIDRLQILNSERGMTIDALVGG